MTGQVSRRLIGNDAFQEADITGITIPITKHNYLIKDVKDLPRIIKEAFYIASTGRPGPVLVDIPKDVQQSSSNSHIPTRSRCASYKPTYSGASADRSKKPASSSKRQSARYSTSAAESSLPNACEEVRQLAETIMAPVTPRSWAKGRSRGPSAIAGHAGHARHALRELRDHRLRPADRHRRPVRRPRHGQDRQLRPEREDHPHRRRSGGTGQERPVDVPIVGDAKN